LATSLTFFFISSKPSRCDGTWVTLRIRLRVYWCQRRGQNELSWLALRCHPFIPLLKTLPFLRNDACGQAAPIDPLRMAALGTNFGACLCPHVIGVLPPLSLPYLFCLSLEGPRTPQGVTLHSPLCASSDAVNRQQSRSPAPSGLHDFSCRPSCVAPLNHGLPTPPPFTRRVSF